METLCLVSAKKQVVLTVPACMQGRHGSKWAWLFLITYDAQTGKAVCGFRSGRNDRRWSGWMGTWTMSKCGKVIIVNVGRFSYVLKVRNMMMKCGGCTISQKQLCDLSEESGEEWEILGEWRLHNFAEAVVRP